MNDLTPDQAGRVSCEAFSAMFASAKDFGKSAELLEMAYWNKVLTIFGGTMDDIDKLPHLVRDGIVFTIKEMRSIIVKYFLISDTTVKFYSIIRKPESEWSDEEKSIYEYVLESTKAIQDVINKLEEDDEE